MPSFDERYQLIKDGLDGGMSSASIFRDTHLERDVLLKKLAPDVDKTRLLDEISALMKLRSKHVVQIYDVLKEEHEVRAIIEEFVNGPDLTMYGRSFPNTADYLKTFWQISSGIEDIHSSDVIHRDIKPNNMKFDPEGIIKIFDFGLSRSTEDNSTVGYKGTLYFSAPELFQAGKHYFTKSIDTYAFGVTCLALANVPLPDYFSKPGLPIDPSSADLLPSDFPPEIKQLIINCLKQDPDQRPQMTEIRTSLERHLLRDKHRALLVFKGQKRFLDHTNRKVSLSINDIGSLSVEYDGLGFFVSACSGEITVNNSDAFVGQEIKGSKVISIGSIKRSHWQRAHVSFDVSHPEVVV